MYFVIWSLQSLKWSSGKDPRSGGVTRRALIEFPGLADMVCGVVVSCCLFKVEELTPDPDCEIFSLNPRHFCSISDISLIRLQLIRGLSSVIMVTE